MANKTHIVHARLNHETKCKLENICKHHKRTKTNMLEILIDKEYAKLVQ